MNRELRLRFLKALVNVPVRVLDRCLGFPEAPRHLQTCMLLRAYKRMAQAYQLDCLNGVFGVKPDGNFERLLRTLAKLLAHISEQDRYYRAWLGLTFILAADELAKVAQAPTDLKKAIKTQCLMDLDFVSDEHVHENKRRFLEMALANYLTNLTGTKITNKKGGKNRK